ncbi:hypothetical protein EC988_009253 [Linderina pennispora]|nr:hypothetical protein EC988_009253 [Linderina pennispora]
MSSWIVPAVFVPVALGVGTSFKALSNSDWHTRLRKPKYNAPHASLLPVLVLLYTLQGIGSYLVSNEMVVGDYTAELVAQIAGQAGLGFFWLQLTFLAFWPRLLACGVRLALADLCVAVVVQVLGMIQFFRVSVAGGLLMLVSLLGCVALGVWNLALVRKGS